MPSIRIIDVVPIKSKENGFYNALSLHIVNLSPLEGAYYTVKKTKKEFYDKPSNSKSSIKVRIEKYDVRMFFQLPLPKLGNNFHLSE